MKNIDNPILNYAPEELYSGISLAVAKAIRQNDSAGLKSLLRSSNFNPNDRGLEDMPLVIWAASHDNINAVRDLLAAKAPANDTFKAGEINYNLTALATGSENPEFLAALLDAGANPNGLPGTESPLFVAIHGKRWDRLDLLIQHGALLDQADEAGVTPVMELAYVDAYDQVIKLLKLGANPNHKSSAGMSLRSIVKNHPLDPASEEGKLQQLVLRNLAQRDLSE